MQCLSQFVMAEKMYLSLSFLEQKRFHAIGRSKDVSDHVFFIQFLLFLAQVEKEGSEKNLIWLTNSCG